MAAPNVSSNSLTSSEKYAVVIPTVLLPRQENIMDKDSPSEPAPSSSPRMVPPAEIADPLSENPEIRVVENPLFNKLPIIPDLAKSLAPIMPMLHSFLPNFNFPLPGLNSNSNMVRGPPNPSSIFPIGIPKIDLPGMNAMLPRLPGPPPKIAPPNHRPNFYIKHEPLSPTSQKFKKPKTPYRRKEKPNQKPEKERKSSKAIKRELVEPSGPPFQLDYAPHLRCNGFRIETLSTPKSPDVITIDDGPSNRQIMKNVPPMQPQGTMDLIKMLSRPLTTQPPMPQLLPVTPRDKDPILGPNPFGLGNLNMDFSKLPGFDGGLEGLKNQIALMQTQNQGKNQFHGNVLTSGPPTTPALHLLPPDVLSSLQLPAASSGKPISAPFSPNQQVYMKLKESYPEWRIGYLRKRANLIHSNSLIKHRINTLLRPKGMTIQFHSIEKEFEEEKVKIFRKLKPEESEEFCTMFLKNCVHHERTMNEKERELDDDVELFSDWLRSQIDPTPERPFLDTVLPTFGQIVNMIKEAFLFLNLFDCDENQRQQLISIIQFDWTDPASNPQRIITFSNNIKLPAIRILEILQEAREKLRILIFSKNYYMSIDEDVPQFEY